MLLGHGRPPAVLMLGTQGSSGARAPAFCFTQIGEEPFFLGERVGIGLMDLGISAPISPGPNPGEATTAGTLHLVHDLPICVTFEFTLEGLIELMTPCETFQLRIRQ